MRIALTRGGRTGLQRIFGILLVARADRLVSLRCVPASPSHAMAIFGTSRLRLSLSDFRVRGLRKFDRLLIVFHWHVCEFAVRVGLSTGGGNGSGYFRSDSVIETRATRIVHTKTYAHTRPDCARNIIILSTNDAYSNRADLRFMSR